MNRPFFRSKRDVRETIFSQKNILPRNVFCFFSSRKEIVPLSFLSRKKKRSACAGSAAPQTDGRRHILRCRRSKYRSGYASLLRLVSARVRRACAPAFPCKLTTQKKVDFRRVFFAAFSVSANLQHKTDGSHTNRPFFPSKQDVRENVFSQKNILPRSVFCFFSSRKEIVPFSFLSRKKRKRTPLEEKKSFPQRAPSYLPKMRFSSDGGSVAFGTKAGAAVASDGAAAGVGAASAGPP